MTPEKKRPAYRSLVTQCRRACKLSMMMEGEHGDDRSRRMMDLNARDLVTLRRLIAKHHVDDPKHARGSSCICG